MKVLVLNVGQYIKSPEKCKNKTFIKENDINKIIIAEALIAADVDEYSSSTTTGGNGDRPQPFTAIWISLQRMGL